MYRGVVRVLEELGPHLALYFIKREQYPFAERSLANAGSKLRSKNKRTDGKKLDIDGQPQFDWPGYNNRSTSYVYPRLNKDKSLKDNCYVYAMASMYTNEEYRPRDFRILARFPVKLRGCYAKLDCVFEYDKSRAEGHSPGQICDTYQDFGAPIMCGKSVTGISATSDFFQRRYLRLSYIMRWPERYDPEYAQGHCYDSFYAVRVADHMGTIENAIERLKKSGKL
jgi:hypothetical protein